MLIDPRFSYDEEYLQCYEWDYLEEEFIELFIKSLEKKNSADVAISEALRDEFEDRIASDGENSMDIDDIWATKKKNVSHLSSSQNEAKAAIKAELGHYRHNNDRPSRNDDVFGWWRINKERFPLIAEGARILLSIPATSVSSERTFSMAGLLYANTFRNRLHARTAEMLILIKANLKKLKLAPSTEPDNEELMQAEESEDEELDND
uniref:HAT C-terminal dimerisation domain-containing protein n=1 Tax=Acrobeloides nanus TaxID=290746 RepID=A0A914DI61_9BILA